jgi:hypothetical protein
MRRDPVLGGRLLARMPGSTRLPMIVAGVSFHPEDGTQHPVSRLACVADVRARHSHGHGHVRARRGGQDLRSPPCPRPRADALEPPSGDAGGGPSKEPRRERSAPRCPARGRLPPAGRRRASRRGTARPGGRYRAPGLRAVLRPGRGGSRGWRGARPGGPARSRSCWDGMAGGLRERSRWPPILARIVHAHTGRVCEGKEIR